MLKVLNSGGSGLNAQQLKVDTLANNLANTNTPGFKKSRADFSELVSQELVNSGIPVALGSNSIVGTGVRVAEVVANFKSGNIIETGRPLDLAVQGEGFLKVVKNGEECYTRDGSFTLDPDGNLVTSSGCKLDGIQFAPGAEKLTVAPDGTAKIEESGNVADAATIQLYKFAGAAGLNSIGENIFSFDGAATEVMSGSRGSEGFGTVRHGHLEMANVDLVEEMANLIEAQRAYGFNARTVRTSDEMWSMANNLRK
jgi:flagellar basal-body rod protein FlgG